MSTCRAVLMLDEPALRLCAGITCVVRGAILCDRACDVATDLFCGAPNSGDATSPTAARQLTKTKRFIFIFIPPSGCVSHNVLTSDAFEASIGGPYKARSTGIWKTLHIRKIRGLGSMPAHPRCEMPFLIKNRQSTGVSHSFFLVRVEPDR